MDKTFPGQENPAAPITNIDVSYTDDTPLEDIQANYKQIGSDYNQFVENSYNNVQARQQEHIGNNFGGSPYNYHTYYEPGASGFASAMRQTGTQEAFKVGMERGKAEAEANLEAAKNNYSNAVSAYNAMAEQYNSSKNDPLISTFDSSLKPEGVTDEELMNYMVSDTDDPYAAALRLHQATGGGSNVTNWDDRDVRTIANHAVRDSSEELRKAYEAAEAAGFGSDEAQAFFDRPDVSYIWTRAYEEEWIRRQNGDSFAKAYADNTAKIYSISEQALDFKNGKLNLLTSGLLTEAQLADIGDSDLMNVNLLDLAVIPETDLSSTWKEYIQEHRLERGTPAEYDIRFNYDDQTVTIKEKTFEEVQHTGADGTILNVLTTTSATGSGITKTRKETGFTEKTISFGEAEELVRNKFGVTDLKLESLAPRNYKGSAAAADGERELARHALYEAMYGAAEPEATVQTTPTMTLNNAIESIFGCSASDLQALQKMQEDAPEDYSKMIDSASHAFSLASVFEIADGVKQYHTADGWITPDEGTLIANVPDAVLSADGSVNDEALKKLVELIPQLDDPTANQEEVMKEIEKQSKEYFNHLMVYFTETSLVDGESSRDFHNSVMASYNNADPTKAMYKGKSHQDIINEWKKALKEDFDGTVEKYAALKARAYASSDSYIASEDGKLVNRKKTDSEGKPLLGTKDDSAQHQFDDMPVEDALALVNILDASMRRYDSNKADNIPQTLATGGLNADIKTGVNNFANNLLTDAELFAGIYAGLAYGGAMILSGYGKTLLEQNEEKNKGKGKFEVMINNLETIANEVPTLNIAGHDTLGELLFGDLEEDDFAYDTRRREMLRSNVMSAVDPLAKEVFTSEDLAPLWKDNFTRTIVTDIVPLGASIIVEAAITAGIGAAIGWADDAISKVAPKISAKLQLATLSSSASGISDDVVRELVESRNTVSAIEQIVDNTDDTISAVMRSAAGQADDLAEGVISKTISSADEIAEAQTKINSIRQAESISNLMASTATADLNTKMSGLNELGKIIASGSDEITETFSKYAKQMFTKSDFKTALADSGIKLSKSNLNAAYDTFINSAAKVGAQATARGIEEAVIGSATGLSAGIIELSGQSTRTLALQIIEGQMKGNTGLYGKLLADGATPKEINEVIKGFIKGSADTVSLGGKAWGKTEILRNIATKSNSVRKGLIAKRIATDFTTDVVRDNLRNYKSPEFDAEGNTVRTTVDEYFSNPANFAIPALITGMQLGGGAAIRRLQSARLSKQIEQAQRAVTATAKTAPDYADKLNRLLKLDDKARKLSEKMLDRSLSYGDMRATYEQANEYINSEFDEIYKTEGLDLNHLQQNTKFADSAAFKKWVVNKYRPEDSINLGYTASISDAANTANMLRRAFRMDEGIGAENESYITLGNTRDLNTQKEWVRTVATAVDENKLESILNNKRLKTVWDKLEAAHKIQLDAVEDALPQIKGVRESTAVMLDILDAKAKEQVARGLMKESDVLVNYFPTAAFLIGDPTDGVRSSERGLLLGTEQLSEGVKMSKGTYRVPLHGEERKITIEEILDAFDNGKDYVELTSTSGEIRKIKLNPQGFDPMFATMAYVNTANNAMYGSRMLDGAKGALETKQVIIGGKNAAKAAAEADANVVQEKLTKLSSKATTLKESGRAAEYEAALRKAVDSDKTGYGKALANVDNTLNELVKRRSELLYGARPEDAMTLSQILGDVPDSDITNVAAEAHKKVRADIKAVQSGKVLSSSSSVYTQAIDSSARNMGTYDYDTVVLAAIDNKYSKLAKEQIHVSKIRPKTENVGNALRDEAADWLNEPVVTIGDTTYTRDAIRKMDVSRPEDLDVITESFNEQFSKNARKTKSGKITEQYKAVAKEARAQALTELRQATEIDTGYYAFAKKMNELLPDKRVFDDAIDNKLWSNVVGLSNSEVTYDDLYAELQKAYNATDDVVAKEELRDAGALLAGMQNSQRFTGLGDYSIDDDNFSVEANSPVVDIKGNIQSDTMDRTAEAFENTATPDGPAIVHDYEAVKKRVDALAKQFQEGGALKNIRETAQKRMVQRNTDVKSIMDDFERIVSESKKDIPELATMVDNMTGYRKKAQDMFGVVTDTAAYDNAAALGLARPGSAVSYSNNPAQYQAIAARLAYRDNMPENLGQAIVSYGRRSGGQDADILMSYMRNAGQKMSNGATLESVFEIPSGEKTSLAMDLINFDAGTPAGRLQQFEAAYNLLDEYSGENEAIAKALPGLRTKIDSFKQYLNTNNADPLHYYGDVYSYNSGSLVTDLQSVLANVDDKVPMIDVIESDVQAKYSNIHHGGYRYTVETPYGKVHFAELRPELGKDAPDPATYGVKPYDSFLTSKKGTLENLQTIEIYAFNDAGEVIDGSILEKDPMITEMFRREVSPTDEEDMWDTLVPNRVEDTAAESAVDNYRPRGEKRQIKGQVVRTNNTPKLGIVSADSTEEYANYIIDDTTKNPFKADNGFDQFEYNQKRLDRAVKKHEKALAELDALDSKTTVDIDGKTVTAKQLKDLIENGDLKKYLSHDDVNAYKELVAQRDAIKSYLNNPDGKVYHSLNGVAYVGDDFKYSNYASLTEYRKSFGGVDDDSVDKFTANADDKAATKAMKKELKKGRTASNATLRSNESLEKAGLNKYRADSMNDASRRLTLDRFTDMGNEVRKYTGNAQIDNDMIFINNGYADLMVRYNEKPLSQMNAAVKVRSWVSDRAQFIQNMQLAGGVGPYNALSLAQLRSAILENPAKANEFIKLYASIRNNRTTLAAIKDNIPFLAEMSIEMNDPTIVGDLANILDMRVGQNDGGTLQRYYSKFLDRLDHETDQYPKGFKANLSQDVSAWFEDPTFLQALPAMRAQMMVMNYDAALSHITDRFEGKLSADEIKEAAMKLSYVQTQKFWHPEQFLRNQFDVDAALEKINNQNLRKFVGDNITGEGQPNTLLQSLTNAFFALRYKQTFVNRAAQGAMAMPNAIKSAFGDFTDVNDYINAASGTRLATSVASLMGLGVLAAAWCTAVGAPTAWDDFTFEPQGDEVIHIPSVLQKIQTIGQLWLPNDTDENGRVYVNPNKEAIKLDPMFSMWTLPNTTMRAVNKVFNSQTDDYAAPQRGLPFLSTNSAINKAVNSNIGRAITDEIIGSNLLSPFKAMHEIIVNGTYFGNNIWERKYLPNGKENPNYDPGRNVTASVMHLLGFDQALDPNGYNRWVKGGENMVKQDQIGTVSGSGIFQHEYVTAVLKMMDGDYWDAVAEAGELPLKFQKLSSTARTELNTVVKNTLAHYGTDYKNAIKNARDNDAKDEAYADYVKKSADAVAQWSAKYGYVLGENQELVAYATRMLMAMTAGEYDDDMAYLQNTYWKATQIAQIESTDNLFFKDDDLQGWLDNGGTAEDFYKEKNRRSEAYNQALNDEWEAREALRAAGYDEKTLENYTYEDLRAAQRTASNKIYTEILGTLNKPVGEFSNFKEMKDYYEELIDNASTTKQKTTIANKYDQTLFDVIAPYVDKYGASILTDTKVEGTGLPQKLSDYVIIPADQKYYGKTPRASFMKDYFGVGYRNKTNLPSDEDVVKKFTRAMSLANNGKSAAASSILDALTKKINSGEAYASDEDYNRIIRLKALTTRR